MTHRESVSMASFSHRESMSASGHSGGNSAAIDALVMDRVKSREEELRRREKEVKQRFAQVKERADELESAKQQVDSMLGDLDRRETNVVEMEKKHGSIARREEAAQQRDVVLSDREMQLQNKMAELNRREKENATIHRKRLRECDLAMVRLANKETEMNEREAAVQRVEEESNFKQRSFRDEMYRQEASVEEREREVQRVGTAQGEEWKDLHRRQTEMEQAYLELQDRIKFQRAEHVDLESRDRDLKWREEQLRVAQEENSKKKTQLLEWEAKLTDAEASCEELQAKLVFDNDTSVETQARLTAKIQQFLDAETDLKEREELVAIRLQTIDDKEADIVAREKTAREQVAEAAEQTRKAHEAQRAMESTMQEIRRKKKLLDDQLYILREKERSLKDWLVELEFRRATLRRKELHPAPYLHNVSADSEADPGFSPQFNGAIVNMQLQRIQGAYLGATLKTRIKQSKFQESKRRTTPVSEMNSDRTGADVELVTSSIDVSSQLNLMEEEFRNLVTGYMALNENERRALFTSEEEIAIIDAVDLDVASYDEEVFLEELTLAPLPPIEINVSPQDLKMLALVKKWLGDRRGLIEERRRRVATRKVKAFDQALAALRGKVKPIRERRKALEDHLGKDGNVAMSDQTKQRSRTRLPAIISNDPFAVQGGGGRASTPGSPLAPLSPATPGGRASTPAAGSAGNRHQRGLSTPLSKSPTPHAMELFPPKSPLNSSATSAGPIRSPQCQNTSGLGPQQELVDSLPPYLRYHYIGPSAARLRGGPGRSPQARSTSADSSSAHEESNSSSPEKQKRRTANDAGAESKGSFALEKETQPETLSRTQSRHEDQQAQLHQTMSLSASTLDDAAEHEDEEF